MMVYAKVLQEENFINLEANHSFMSQVINKVS